MRSINSLTDATIGSTIQFLYYGGSRPGCTRRVEVTDYNRTKNGITGVDKDIGEPRTFLNAHAENIRVTCEYSPGIPQASNGFRKTAVHFTVAIQELKEKLHQLEMEQLAEVFALHRGGVNPGVDTSTGNVTYETPQKTFNVNGRVMTVDEMAQLVKDNS